MRENARGKAEKSADMKRIREREQEIDPWGKGGTSQRERDRETLKRTKRSETNNQPGRTIFDTVKDTTT